MEIVPAAVDKSEEYKKTISSVEDKIHISFSEFSKFESCGHRHLIEKYLKLVPDQTSIHLIFGNSIHKAIETGIKQKSNLKSIISVFKEDFTKEMMDKMHDSEDYKFLNQYLGEGENIIRCLSKEKVLTDYDVVGVEFYLYEPLFKNFYFKGYIDLILKHKTTGRYLIIDWKTSGEQWDVSKKKKDEIFLCQMRFYKYFVAKKMNIPLNEIDCKYVVLNRLKNKKYPEIGYGEVQHVEIFADESDIEEALIMLAKAIKAIHIENSFPKAKLIGKKANCFFCPFKNNIGHCNNDANQHIQLLKESRQN